MADKKKKPIKIPKVEIPKADLEIFERIQQNLRRLRRLK
jgi:hypothetical protein